jgi:membrane-associated phospholipid phosphatase
MPMAAGLAAHETDASLGRRQCRWPPADDVNRQLKSYRGGRIPNGIRCHPARRPEGARSAVRLMISLASWWWPKRPARVPRARTTVLLTGLGAALFGVAAILLKTGTLGWDVSLFRILNQVPAAAASVLTPLSHLFLPAAILAVVVLAAIYVVARNHSVLPVATAAAAAGLAWALAHAAKAIADRPRPYEVLAGAVLRQQPAHGTSFPSSHTAVTLAVVIALAPFLARPLAAVGIGYAVLVGWSRVYLGVHYPLDVLAGAGLGLAAGGVIVLAAGTLLRRAGRAANSHDAATEVQARGTGPESQSASKSSSRSRTCPRRGRRK